MPRTPENKFSGPKLQSNTGSLRLCQSDGQGHRTLEEVGSPHILQSYHLRLMPRMKNDGVIFGILYDSDADYPACHAFFFPDKTYRTHSLATHEAEPKTEYFLVTNADEARVYTNGADARSSPLRDSLWTGHHGLAAVAHALGDWCRSKHGHASPQRISPRTKKPSADDVSSLTTYCHLRPFPPAPIQPKPLGPFTTRTRSHTAGARRRHLSPFPPAPIQPKVLGTRTRSHTAGARRSNTPSKASSLRRVAGIATSSSSVSGAASKRSRLSPPPYAGLSNTGSDTPGGIIVSAEGHFFRSDAEVTAALQKSSVEIKMFRDVTSAREWFMALPPEDDDDD
ncbi:hypothetical protein B0H16DRAFT_1470653 [Mycena metata]|uniref:Uncharacterized protein n=1 Tax=Mycena metata TaxID=1033252 RepID=A0AAD7HTJ3_9AGAR|nr:hypothetical protein B0H16DRAFT_1470653 [Mycena metata]